VSLLRRTLESTGYSALASPPRLMRRAVESIRDISGWADTHTQRDAEVSGGEGNKSGSTARLWNSYLLGGVVDSVHNSTDIVFVAVISPGPLGFTQYATLFRRRRRAVVEVGCICRGSGGLTPCTKW